MKLEENTVMAIAKEMHQRVEVACEYSKAKRNQTLMRNNKKTRTYSATYNLYAIAIPKIGSTFLKQMFNILNNGARTASKEFTKSRKLVHSNQVKIKEVFIKYSNETVVIAPVRHPYSRLFAAFVDKIFLPNNQRLVRDIIWFTRHNNASRKRDSFLANVLGESRYSNPSFEEHNVSFQDFIEYATQFKETATLYGHYRPCFRVLQPMLCRTDNIIIVKQESFADDIKYILKDVRVNEKDTESYETIKKALVKARAEVSVPGIIKVVFSKFPGGHDVWNRHFIAERLWQSFQIQGYIDINSRFPYDLFPSNLNITESDVTSVILREILKNPLTSDQRNKQRHAAITEAFKDLHEDVIKEINQMFADDFDAFQYDRFV